MGGRRKNGQENQVTVGSDNFRSMDVLQKQWTAIKARLMTIVNRVEEDGVTTENVSILNERVDSLWSDLKALYKDIIFESREEDLETWIEKFAVEENKIMDLKLKLQIPTKILSVSSNKYSAMSTEIKLPALELPSFGGDITDWAEFSDLFRAGIQENSTLSDAQKLQYLKGALKGEAAKVVRHMPITNANYEKAWALLRGRYEKRRETANVLAGKIINLPDVKNGRASIRELLDAFYEADKSLEAMIQDDSPWELLVINIITKFLDNDTVEAWELSLKTTNLPSLQELLDFLEVRSRAIRNRGTKESSSDKKFHQPKKLECPKCNGAHVIRHCPHFERANVQERRSMVSKMKICFNCLSPNHKALECKSSARCQKCQRSHHTTLHEEPVKPTSFASIARQSTNTGESLMPTAMIEARHQEKGHQLRALLDSGSQFNIISSATAKRLGLSKRRASLHTNTVAGTCLLPYQTSLKIGKGNWEREVTCYLSDKLNFCLPTINVGRDQGDHIKGLKLADPQFYNPRPIDLILGINIWSEVRENGLLKGNKSQPSAQKTVLGWTLAGPTSKGSMGAINLLCTESEDIKKFWELEELPQGHILSEEDTCAETYYKKSTIRLSDGTYQTKYPFYKEFPSLGRSRDQAITRFLRLEKQLERKNSREEYSKVLAEYATLGHMVRVTREDKNKDSYYLPHHAVYKDSTTTKLRVVFDASAKSSNGNSLNDNMINGHKCQDDLFHILLRFQKNPVAVCADIEKMYRQIKIHPDHQDYQRIIWRNSSNEPLQEFKLTTVTFGMKASPFLATRTLLQLSQDEGDSFSEAKNVLQQDFYVDDLMTGSKSVKAAKKMCQQLDNLLRAGGFALRKWCSNEPSITRVFNEPHCLENVSIAEDESIKTLGLQWKPLRDVFTFQLRMPERRTHTKRTLLSDMSRIFDPLGWIAPITIVAKIIFQELWLLPITWDQELPKPILERWENYRKDLNIIEQMEIIRYLPYNKFEDLMLCGFCDASEKAYGAVIYLRSNINGKVRIKLLVSKSRVGPLKTTTIPRLELCSAVLLAKLMKETKRALKMEIEAFYWSDSSVVLHWIAQHPSRWKTFVGHRVAAIQEVSNVNHWLHVSTNENPADLISRGSSAAQLENSSLWWTGPDWLKEINFKKRSVKPIDQIPEMRKKKKIGCSVVLSCDGFVNKFSNLDKLLRITSIVLRFIRKTKKRSTFDGPIRVTELREALLQLLRGAQQETFTKEIEALKKGERISNKSSILSLTPFVDDKGLLRVGGRLLHADLTYDQKHQILLPYNHHLTTLIIEDIHRKNGHSGNQLTLATLRQRYWLPRSKQLIRRLIHKCVICIRYRSKVHEQLMGQLPRERVTPNRPFLKTGIDYCGPIMCKEMIGRNRRSHKAYVAVFICMATKAIHLEAVPSLTMESFLAALTRFVSRRGLPSDLYSDNGTNFVAANSHLRELYHLLRNNENEDIITRRMAERGIQWHFIPPYSPHFGGLWEAGVKSFKYHFKRIMGNEVFNFEEFSTTLCKIEAYLNSRPLCPLDTDELGLEVLTPGHFLIGEPLNTLPEATTKDKKSLKTRFQLIQRLTSHFWKIWQKEYLSTLQVKTKWKLESEPIQEGDLVLIKESNLPPRFWKLGRVISTSKDDSGRARVFKLRTAGGTTSRTLSQIVKLFSTNA